MEMRLLFLKCLAGIKLDVPYIEPVGLERNIVSIREEHGKVDRADDFVEDEAVIRLVGDPVGGFVGDELQRPGMKIGGLPFTIEKLLNDVPRIEERCHDNEHRCNDKDNLDVS